MAQALAVSGRLRCNGKAVDRAHHAVNIGDVLTFFAAGRVRAVRVEGLPSRRGPASEAQACYQDLPFEPERAAGASPGANRPAPTANVSQENAAD